MMSYYPFPDTPLVAEPLQKQSSSSSEIGSKSHGVSLAIVAVAIVAVLVVIVFVFGFGGMKQAFQGALPPNIQITSRNAREGLSGFDWTGWVDVSVYNSGGKGTITVQVTVYQGSGQWTKSKSVYLDANQSNDMTFEFKEISFGTSWSYMISVL